jgi:hypothetical protein
MHGGTAKNSENLSGIRYSLKECFVNWMIQYQISYNRMLVFLYPLNNYQSFEKRHVELVERRQLVVQSHFKVPEKRYSLCLMVEDQIMDMSYTQDVYSINGG